MKMTNKRLLFGASAVIALTLAGCNSTDSDTTTEDGADNTEVVQQTQPLVIEKPEILDVEDDVVDTEKLQANLDAINDGERLDTYNPVSDEERVLEMQSGFETDDTYYNRIDPQDLNEGTHLAYIGRDTCPYCLMLRANKDQVLEQLELEVQYVDTDNKEYEAYMVENFGLQSVPMLAVFHEGEVVAMFPQASMYLEEGVDYQSMANGLGDLTNIYLSFKYDLVGENEADFDESEQDHGHGEDDEDLDHSQDEETDSEE